MIARPLLRTSPNKTFDLGHREQMRSARADTYRQQLAAPNYLANTACAAEVEQVRDLLGAQEPCVRAATRGWFLRRG